MTRVEVAIGIAALVIFAVVVAYLIGVALRKQQLLRRAVCRRKHRCHLDGHLLPAILPGDHTEAAQRAVLPDGGDRATGRLPRVPALPAGRGTGLARVGRPGGRGRPRDAADRGRHRGP